MNPQFRRGEIVRISGEGDEAVVEDVFGPNESGNGWSVTLRLAGAGERDALVVCPEDDLEPTGLAEDEVGERVPLGAVPASESARDCIALRLFTEIADGIDAARIAGEIEELLVDLLGQSDVSIEAERHWAEPHNFELAVTVVPEAAPAEAVRAIARSGEAGWLACRDDGWRCDLWWSATRDPDAILLVPEVHAAEISLLPWSSPARRPEQDRPLVVVSVPDDEPQELQG